MGVSLKDPQDGDLAEISDINVTPFIDVILVLLIIFMVAAPLSTVDISVNLPVSNAQAQPRPDKPVYLTVKDNLGLALGNNEIPRPALKAALETETNGDHEQKVFLRADGAVTYRDLMDVMNLLRDAGYLKIALVTLESAGQLQAAPPAQSTPETSPAGAETPSAAPVTPPAATPGSQ